MIVGTLIEAASDRDHAVREIVITSLRRIAQKHASVVLKDTVAYRMRNPKVKNMLMGLHKFISHAVSPAGLNLFLGISRRMGENQCVFNIFKHLDYSVSS